MHPPSSDGLDDEQFRTPKLLNLMFGPDQEAADEGQDLPFDHEVHLRQVVSGITHEINRPLACANASLSMLRELLTVADTAARPNRFEDIRTLLDDGMEDIQRISDLL